MVTSLQNAHSVTLQWRTFELRLWMRLESVTEVQVCASSGC